MLSENLLSEWPVAQNWGFIIFLFCFFVSVRLFEGRKQLLSSMLNRLFRENDRQSIFSDSISNELISRILLSLQTVVLLAVIFYRVLFPIRYSSSEANSQLFLTMGEIFLVVIIFILYKFLSTWAVGVVFFHKENVHRWNETFFSLISICGLVLFIPALLMFYIEEAHFFYYFVLLFLFFVEILVFYKVYSIFFHHKGYLLHFILYLCAQEIAPLYLVYRAVVYFFTM
jgi:hypothetical protein